MRLMEGFAIGVQIGAKFGPMEFVHPEILWGLSALAIPIIVLYEISIICARFIEKKREDDAALDDEPYPDPKPGGCNSSNKTSGGNEEAGP